MSQALESKAIRRVSFPSDAWNRWSQHFDARFWFMEDIRDRPYAIRDEIFRFLGADPARAGLWDPATNTKAGRAREEMTPELRRTLINHFAGEIRACAKTFSGRAETWPEKYGLTADSATVLLDQELEEQRSTGEAITFAEFYAKTVFEDIKSGKRRHPTLGPLLKESKPWSEAGTKQFQELMNVSGLYAMAGFRVVDYGCGTLRLGQHFIRSLPSASYVGLDVIPELIEMGRELVGEQVLVEKKPVLGLIGDPQAENAAAEHDADLVISAGVAFHIHPDEIDVFARNVDRFSSKPGCKVLFHAMISDQEERYAHRGWARPLDFYLNLFPGLQFIRTAQSDPRVKNGKHMKMDLLEFHRK